MAARTSPRRSARPPAEARRSAARKARSSVTSGFRAKLGSVSMRLFEVIAHDLVQLDEIGRVVADPGSKALMQIGTCRFRKRVVGGVADQEMSEPEGVFSGQLRPVGAKKLPPYERRQGRKCLGRRR